MSDVGVGGLAGAAVGGRMSVRRRSGGSGEVATRSRACGGVVVKPPEEDRAPAASPALERAALVELLNGESNPGIRGFNAQTYDEDRILFVP